MELTFSNNLVPTFLLANIDVDYDSDEIDGSVHEV